MKNHIVLYSNNLTLFFSLFPFDPHENIRGIKREHRKELNDELIWCYIAKIEFAKFWNIFQFTQINFTYFTLLPKRCLHFSPTNFFSHKFLPLNTNADLKFSLHVCVHIKTIPWKFCILDPKNSWVIYLWTLQIS